MINSSYKSYRKDLWILTQHFIYIIWRLMTLIVDHCNSHTFIHLSKKKHIIATHHLAAGTFQQHITGAKHHSASPRWSKLYIFVFTHHNTSVIQSNVMAPYFTDEICDCFFCLPARSVLLCNIIIINIASSEILMVFTFACLYSVL